MKDHAFLQSVLVTSPLWASVGTFLCRQTSQDKGHGHGNSQTDSGHNAKCWMLWSVGVGDATAQLTKAPDLAGPYQTRKPGNVGHCLQEISTGGKKLPS